MRIEQFEPSVDKDHKYAVAVPAGEIVVPIQSYKTLKELREGYKSWRQYALDKNITKPVPIEFSNKKGKCRILTDIIQDIQD